MAKSNDKSTIIEYDKIRRMYNIFLENRRELYESIYYLLHELYFRDVGAISVYRESEKKNFARGFGNRFADDFYSDAANDILMHYDKAEYFPEGLRQELDVPFPENEDIFNKMPYVQKILLELDLQRNLTIIAARLANAENRKKDKSLYVKPGEYNKILSQKQLWMSLFLARAKVYNDELRKYDLSDEYELAYGIYRDKRGDLALLASIPGFTRLSLHFGNESVFYKVLNDANAILTQYGSDTYPIDLYQMQSLYKYPYRNFDVRNTGLINNYTNDSEKFYRAKLEDVLSNSGADNFAYAMGDFCCLMYPQLNDREIMHVAEKSQFGKKQLDDVSRVLYKRNKRNYTVTDAHYSETQYVWEMLKNSNVGDRIDTLNRMWQNYKSMYREDDSIAAAVNFCDIVIGEKSDYIIGENIGIHANIIKRRLGEILTQEIRGSSEDELKKFIANTVEEDFQNFSGTRRFSNVFSRCLGILEQSEAISRILELNNIGILDGNTTTNGKRFVGDMLYTLREHRF